MPSSTKPDDSDALYSEIPLFAPAGHEIPRLAADQTAEDLPPALGALSHLLYDEESPEEKAEALREKGNELLKRGGIKERYCIDWFDKLGGSRSIVDTEGVDV